MLSEKYFNIPLWVWIITIIFLFVIFISPQKKLYSSETQEEISKECFVDSNQKPKKISIYNFNTTWCGWSRKFQPEWDLFANYMKDPKNNVNNIEVKDIKCENNDDQNDEMCKKYNVPGYPYIVFDIDGVHEQYKDERTADALIKYISTLKV
jgi:thiol-disulfide isomerase/thioredoxin